MTRLLVALGWPETPASDAHHRTFQCTNGVVLALYPARSYEADLGEPAVGFRGVTLCVNLDSAAEVADVHRSLQVVEDVELLGEPAQAAWGTGFSWRDPEGNVWDVAWARDAVLDVRGGVAFP